MTGKTLRHSCAVAAFLAGVGISLPVWADTLDPLFERLQTVEPGEYKPIEDKIWQEWAKSGSPAMDLLLERGRAALEDDRVEEAIEHFTALTDHAPDFAQGWHARATAYYEAELYGPALSDLQVALRLEPRHFGALSGLAVILQDLDRPAQALEVLRAVEAIHPHRENLQERIDQLEKLTAGQRI
ncbi:tetratricopeptide repeat protein [Shimia ponticola]|uniref:tetratricopeptide repeat protein n=1 Tax=Shimia ponticola TaxID=2582893 RepID=UPI0021026917|nr:tetratricopeptide repeat protein [Shimia ponticola]